VALLVALAVCVWTFLRVLPRLDFEGWQVAAFLAGSAVSLVFFGMRAARIARDLWRARPGATQGPGDGSGARD
jgi:hypothetical protein